MARVTVEDCLARVPNRFALTILASRRARSLLEGKGRALVECENKSAVTALREIGDDHVRFVEDVDGVMVEFIEEQRSRLKASTGDGSYLDAAAFSLEGDEGEEVGADIEELTADLEKLGTKPKEKTDDDSEDEEDEEEDEEESSDDEDESSSDDEGDLDSGDDLDEDLGDLDDSDLGDLEDESEDESEDDSDD
ncbi:MAG: DNA-directed RNA polymerase subunit omega [Myxococcales bacterium]|nr:DNA-directed RNA polymerase subunit omega [Myxococcales bacterium]